MHRVWSYKLWADRWIWKIEYQLSYQTWYSFFFLKLYWQNKIVHKTSSSMYYRVAKWTYQGWQTCRPPRLFIWKVVSYTVSENKSPQVLCGPPAIHSMASLLKPFNDIFRAALFSVHIKTGNSNRWTYHSLVSNSKKIWCNGQYKQNQQKKKAFFIVIVFQTVPKDGREKDSDAYVNNTTTTNDSAGTRTPTIREIGLFRYKFQIIRICAFSYQWSNSIWIVKHSTYCLFLILWGKSA